MNTGTKIGFAISLLALSIGTAVAAGPSKGPSSPGGDPSALARAEAKFAHALKMVDQFKAQAAAEGISGDAWRFEMVGYLMQGAEADFAAVSLARSLADAMSASIAVARAGKAAADVSGSAATGGSSASSVADGLGSATTDLVYIPVVPCRIVDTRAGGAAVPAATVKTYAATTGGGANVGHASGCTVSGQIPGTYDVAAIAANVTVDESGLTGFGAGSYLQIYPQGGSTTTSFMNFGPNQIIANAGVVSVNQANSQFSVVSNAASQIIVDAYGVFIAPQPTALECTNTAYSADVPLDTTTRTGLASAPACPTGYARVATMPDANGDFFNLATALIDDGSVFMRYTGSTSVTFKVRGKCCRVPGRN